MGISKRFMVEIDADLGKLFEISVSIPKFVFVCVNFTVFLS